jgi:hypothetical protein
MKSIWHTCEKALSTTAKDKMASGALGTVRASRSEAKAEGKTMELSPWLSDLRSEL